MRRAKARLQFVHMKFILTLGTIIAAALNAAIAQAQLAGHGGPVRSIAVSADGRNVLSGSFDSAAIRWSLAAAAAE